MWNENIQLYPKFKIFNRTLLELHGSPCFVKFVTFVNVLLLT